MFFLWFGWSYGFGGERPTQVECHSHPIISRVHTINMTSLLMLNLITCLRKCLSGIIQVVTCRAPPSLFMLSSSEGSHCVQSTLNDCGVIAPPPLRSCINYLELFCIGDLSTLPIYLIWKLLVYKCIYNYISLIIRHLFIFANSFSFYLFF